MLPGYHIYSFLSRAALGAITLYSNLFRKGKNAKFDRFVSLQRNWKDMTASLPPKKEGECRLWFHASSLGEYQIARPVIAELKKKGGVSVILTFFSSTGIEALKDKKVEADAILPLPFDTPKNAAKFFDAIRPDVGVFMVSEYWPCHLRTLAERNVPVVLMSALLNQPSSKHSVSYNFKKNMLRSFDMVVSHDGASQKNLKDIGVKNPLLIADPLFDNALERAGERFSDPVIERFCGNSGKVLVAGSLHLDEDLDMIATLARRFPETKIIVVPHEIDEPSIKRIMEALPEATALYSKVTEKDDVDARQCLVIDSVGKLAMIYRYGRAAYVGGGFSRLLHSVVEPLAYGVPVAFGPRIHRKWLPAEMMRLGIGTMVRNESDMERWWRDILNETIDPEDVRKKAKELCMENKGGALKLANLIEEVIKR